MKKTKFVILSRHVLDSYESNNTEFLTEDLIDIICNDNTVIVTDMEVLEEIKQNTPFNKYEYSITIERTK